MSSSDFVPKKTLKLKIELKKMDLNVKLSRRERKRKKELESFQKETVWKKNDFFQKESININLFDSGLSDESVIEEDEDYEE